jgi:23S rRNA pseudouridine1911/1915/1917 synthase
MTAQPFQVFHLAANDAGQPLSAALKRLFPDRSWSQVRKLIAGRRVEVNGNLCLDDARSVKGGDVVKVWEQARGAPVRKEDVRLVYVDEHLVVVQKPAGVTTLRHREEGDLPQRRKQLQPTLDELAPRLLAEHLGIRMPDDREAKRRRVRPDKRLVVRAVHRLDRDTSGLMVFARTAEAERRLIRMFAKHEVQRAYVAVVHGRLEARSIETWLVRDRGDGLRGSAPLGQQAEGAQHAVTHVRPMEALADYMVVECRLETGRTHQIRIHLSEIGHRLCGEKVYTHPVGGKPVEDTSGAPRQALHAAELAFLHPFTGKAMRFRMALPKDLKAWLRGLRPQSS